jgi:hypothetical protein
VVNFGASQLVLSSADSGEGGRGPANGRSGEITGRLTREEHMRDVMVRRLGAAIVVVVLGGCGSTVTSDFSPKRGTETREGQLPPHEWLCGLAFGQVAKDDVTAKVSPVSVYLEMRTGGCDTSGTLLGSSSTGTLVMKLDSGGYHVRIGNPTDATVQYSLQVEHLFPGV